MWLVYGVFSGGVSKGTLVAVEPKSECPLVLQLPTLQVSSAELYLTSETVFFLLRAENRIEGWHPHICRV